MLEPIPVHTTPEDFENATLTAHFGFVVEQNSGNFRFRKAPLSKCFPSTLKRKVVVSKFLRFEERLRKALFS